MVELFFAKGAFLICTSHTIPCQGLFSSFFLPTFLFAQEEVLRKMRSRRPSRVRRLAPSTITGMSTKENMDRAHMEAMVWDWSVSSAG